MNIEKFAAKKSMPMKHFPMIKSKFQLIFFSKVIKTIVGFFLDVENYCTNWIQRANISHSKNSWNIVSSKLFERNFFERRNSKTMTNYKHSSVNCTFFFSMKCIDRWTNPYISKSPKRFHHWEIPMHNYVHLHWKPNVTAIIFSQLIIINK